MFERPATGAVAADNYSYRSPPPNYTISRNIFSNTHIQLRRYGMDLCDMNLHSGFLLSAPRL